MIDNAVDTVAFGIVIEDTAFFCVFQFYLPAGHGASLLSDGFVSDFIINGYGENSNSGKMIDKEERIIHTTSITRVVRSL